MKNLSVSISKLLVASLMLLASSPVWATQTIDLITSLGAQIQKPPYSNYTYYVKIINSHCADAASASDDYVSVPTSGNIQIEVSTDSKCTYDDANFQISYLYAAAEVKLEFFRASFKAENDVISYQPWELLETISTTIHGLTINPLYILGSEYNAEIVLLVE